MPGVQHAKPVCGFQIYRGDGRQNLIAELLTNYSHRFLKNVVNRIKPSIYYHAKLNF